MDIYNNLIKRMSKIIAKGSLDKPFKFTSKEVLSFSNDVDKQTEIRALLAKIVVLDVVS